MSSEELIEEKELIEEEELINANYKPNCCKVLCCCICAPCLCCSDCFLNACKENKKSVTFLITMFICLIVGIVLFKLYYGKVLMLWIGGIIIGSFLPIGLVVYLIVWYIVTNCKESYNRTRRELKSEHMSNEGDKKYVV